MAGRRLKVTREDQVAAREKGSYAPGNMGSTNGLIHGMSSERAINDRAQAILTATLEDAQCPDHLRLPKFAASLIAWARAEALASLAWDYLCQCSAEGGMEAIFQPKANVTRTVSEIYTNMSNAALRHRSVLGITPVGWAKIAKDLGIAAAATQDQLGRMGERGGEIARRRLAVVSGTVSDS
jgi:hypothetical protein